MMEEKLVVATTPRVAGETHYLTGLFFGLIAALIVIGIIYIGRVWYRRRRSNVASTVSDLPQDEEEPPPVIVSSSWSSGEDNVYYPPVPTRFLPKPKQSTTTATSHPIYKADSTLQSKPLSTVLPKLQETHFCQHSRQIPQQEQQQNNYQLALHCAPTRPKGLTPPPSNASTSTISTHKTYDSARSITPRRPHRFGTKKVLPKAPPSEQKSEDVNEQSSTANMMAMNKMSKDDAKRMKETSRKRPIRRPIRRPQPVSAEAITAASTASNEGQTLPEDFKDPRQHLYSQEHVVDFQKPEPMLKSDVTQNDETVEMPTKKKQTA